jgi:hypothetical protein
LKAVKEHRKLEGNFLATSLKRWSRRTLEIGGERTWKNDILLYRKLPTKILLISFFCCVIKVLGNLGKVGCQEEFGGKASAWKFPTSSFAVHTHDTNIRLVKSNVTDS